MAATGHCSITFSAYSAEPFSHFIWGWVVCCLWKKTYMTGGIKIQLYQLWLRVPMDPMVLKGFNSSAFLVFWDIRRSHSQVRWYDMRTSSYDFTPSQITCVLMNMNISSNLQHSQFWSLDILVSHSVWYSSHPVRIQLDKRVWLIFQSAYHWKPGCEQGAATPRSQP